MSLIKQLESDLITALKGGEKQKLTVLRGLKSDLKYKQIALGKVLTEADCLAVFSSALKKHKDSIEQFQNAGRDDLVANEQFGADIIQSYLPQQMTEEELLPLIREAIAESGVDSPQKVGLVMKAVMPKVKGRADGKLINKIALKLLS